jgi:hypothetical protein
MDRGSVALEELRDRLSSRNRRAWVRAVCDCPTDAGARLLNALVIIGPQPIPWSERSWVYDECTFVAATVSAGQIASAVSDGLQHLNVGGLEMAFQPTGQVSCQRQPSSSRYKGVSLPYSCSYFTLTTTDRDQTGSPAGYLVGQGDTPSFPTFESAFSAFFFDDFTVTGTRSPALGEIVTCITDERARIRRVKVGPASLGVWLSGGSLQDAFLELNGADYRSVVEVVGREHVVMPLPLGLPTDAWLWLKLDLEWLDYRPLMAWGGQLSPDIGFEQPRDPATELQRLATQGEGPQLEYKAKLPDTDHEKRGAFRTVVAFANGDGGKVLFGIDDDGVVCGLSGEPDKERERLTSLVRDLVSPAPACKIDVRRLDGRTVIVLDVTASGGTLHALTLHRNKPEYFVRRDATTFYARPDEIEAVVTRKD